MSNNIGKRIKKAWNVFINKDNTDNKLNYFNGYYYRPYMHSPPKRNERTIITSIFNRIALDVSDIDIRHCKVDENGRFLNYINSSLDKCLSLEANIDQNAKSFIQDVVMSILDEGCVALVPIDTSININEYNSYDIYTMRTGKIVTWYPDSVEIEVYNDRKGIQENIILPKSKVAIIESPLYSVINEPNSTMQRLIRKLYLLDNIDEQSSSGKLDLIIQLPYVIRSESRKEQAEKRRADIEQQLTGSKYGIAYTDGTEKIIQLNRPVDNNLMKQIEYLTSMLYSQLGITQAILDGTADEKTMINYYSRTIEPIVNSITLEIKRKFLTKTARSQNQTILYFKNPFKLVPVSQIAEIADKFTRNEILTSNEIRQIIGIKPSNDPKADKLLNSNLNHNEKKEEDNDEESK